MLQKKHEIPDQDNNNNNNNKNSSKNHSNPLNNSNPQQQSAPQQVQPIKTPLEKLQEQLLKRQQKKMFMQDVVSATTNVKMEYKSF